MRDLRDPQKLGERILFLWKNEDELMLHAMYDEEAGHLERDIPDYDHGESLVQDTMRVYRRELQEAAERGDRHAAETLKGIPNDDPSGD